MRSVIILAGLAVCLVAPAALADEPAAAPPPKLKSPCAGVYASVGGLSDYRFDGFSESNRQPTWQVTAYCYDIHGDFVGATLTGVDFLDTPRTHLEADWYVGRQFAVGEWSVTATLLYASFPDQRTGGPSYNLIEPEAEASRSFGKLTVKGLAAYSASATSRAWHVKGTAAYQLTPWLRLDADASHYWELTGRDYNAWDVGATATWRRVTLGAHYGGTDRPPSDCFFTDWCAPGPSVALTYRILP